MAQACSPGGRDRNLWTERQAALAEFGRSALVGLDLDAILQDACALVARGLGVPIAKVLEAQPNGGELLVRAAVGLGDLVEVGRTRVPGDGGSAAGYALKTGEPVICHVPTETRFRISEIVRRAGVRVSANVLIRGQGAAFGVLEVDGLDERTFSADDLDFLQSYANLLAAAVERQRASALIQRLADQREALLHEQQHRLRNDLQVVTALLMLEARQAESLEARRRLESVRARIDSLRLVHERLAGSAGLDRIDLADYLRRLAVDRFRLHGLEPGGPIRLEFDLREVALDHQRAVSLGLIANEFLTNSLKHAFPLGQGVVRIALDAPAPGRTRLVLSDDGVGIPPRRREAGRGMGLKLTELFIGKLQAEAEWSGPPGTRLSVEVAG